MRYLLLPIFLVMSIGGVFVSHAFSSEPDGFGKVTARSAAELYDRNCATCHGKDGRAKTLKGKLKHARDLTDSEWQSRVSDERLFNSIVNGKGKMPAYGKKLSEQEIDSLATYVRAFKK